MVPSHSSLCCAFTESPIYLKVCVCVSVHALMCVCVVCLCIVQCHSSIGSVALCILAEFRELLEEHREKRVHDAYALMADIIHHQPQKSREHSKENRKHSTVASGTRVLSQAPLPSGLPRRAKRPMQSARAGSTWTKTTGW